MIYPQPANSKMPHAEVFVIGLRFFSLHAPLVEIAVRDLI
jgi:hypothetical protein